MKCPNGTKRKKTNSLQPGERIQRMERLQLSKRNNPMRKKGFDDEGKGSN